MAAISKDIRAISKVIAIVTGGASGLGKATAARLVQNGARVTIADLPTSKGNDVAKELGEKCTFVPTNVSVLLDRLGVGARDYVLSWGALPLWRLKQRNNECIMSSAHNCEQPYFSARHINVCCCTYRNIGLSTISIYQTSSFLSHLRPTSCSSGFFVGLGTHLSTEFLYPFPLQSLN